MEADYKDKGGKASEGVDVIYFKDNINNVNNTKNSAQVLEPSAHIQDDDEQVQQDSSNGKSNNVVNSINQDTASSSDDDEQVQHDSSNNVINNKGTASSSDDGEQVQKDSSNGTSNHVADSANTQNEGDSNVHIPSSSDNNATDVNIKNNSSRVTFQDDRQDNSCSSADKSACTNNNTLNNDEQHIRKLNVNIPSSDISIRQDLNEEKSHVIQTTSDNVSTKIKIKTKMHCKLFEDNNGALELVKAPKIRPRTKHISIKHHHFREHVRKELIEILPIDAAQQEADMLTKPLPLALFQYFRKLIMGW